MQIVFYGKKSNESKKTHNNPCIFHRKWNIVF